MTISKLGRPRIQLRQAIVTVTRAAAVVAALIGALLFIADRTGLIERYFIYFPRKKLEADPSRYGLAFENISFFAADGKELHGWFVPGRSDVTWLWFHGNAGNIGDRVENLKLLHDELGVNVFLFDYRGYGRSQGRPTEKGTYLDADAALAYLRSRSDVSHERIVYYGRSLGAAVAVDLATRHPPYGLILESPFPSIRYMARQAYPFLPIWPLIKARYDSLTKIAKVEAPILILHGDKDDLVPIDAGRKLFDAAREPKDFYTVEGAGHNDGYIVGGQPYFTALRAFDDRLAR
ncbi:MAG: alpha/beta hydrolase [Chloroflexi bacterium]|nr:alpha/beta hydrolase [Chloroflexota bacterium]